MNTQNVLNIEIDLSKIKTKQQYLITISKFFKFPDYFNFNIDGMNECMRDLSWFSENYINIVFLNIDKVNDRKLRSEIEDNLKTWKEYWDNIDLYEDSNYPEKVVILTIL